MKYLQDYRESKQTALFDKTGSFFAFSNDQFNESKKDGVTYINCGAGLLCDKNHVKELIDGLEQINIEAIAQDILDNGTDAIILRELSNYECYYTGDPSDAIDELKQYGFSKETILKLFNKKRNRIN